jgi:peroxiredoxin
VDEVRSPEQYANKIHKVNAWALYHAIRQRYQAQLGLTFPLLHDSEAQVAALYGARQDDGTVRRTVYLIDTQGMIRYGRPGMHWNDAFLSALSALA